MLAKGAYPAELNNPLPFALISNDEVHGELHITANRTTLSSMLGQ